MKVRLSDAIVSDGDALPVLDDILRFLEEGRHQWVVDDIEGVERSQWVEQAGVHHRARILDLLHKAVTDSAYGETPHTIEIVVGAGEHEVSPSRARRDLAKPAYLVVENATSDGRFLRALIHAYDRPLLRTALQEQWIEIDQAGGKGEIPKRIWTLLHERSADSRRVQALADSDRLAPEDESETVVGMRKAAHQHRVTIHILHKRESENYLPLDAIAHRKHARNKTYQAYRQLDPPQRDHFDMKSGFKRGAKDTAVVEPAQGSLFANVRPAVRRDLVGGFGADCGGWFEDDAGTVPHYINRSTMESRCSTKPGELPAILAKIEEML